jgi:zinc protease
MRRQLSLAVLAVVLAGGSASAQVRDWPQERPPAPLPAREAKFPPYQVRELKNGLKVIAVSHHEQPAVTLRLIVRAGGAQDPADKPGVAAFAAGLLDQGTTSRSAEQIANTIDSIGGAIGSGSGSDLSYITAVVMKDSFDLGLDMVSDLAQHPAFAAEEIERQRKQILSGLQVSYDDPEYLAGVVFDRLVYGFHPYGKPDSGTPSSIPAITRDDLVKFHKDWFGANNAILAIVGDVTPDEAFAGAERAFGTWARSQQAETKGTDAPPPTRRVVIVDRPGAVQTEIRVGNIGLPRRDPDYMALNLALRILGGEGGNRLHRVLRSERGLTYGASAELNALKDTGDVVAETDTRSETTVETLRLLVDEISKLQRQRVNPRELSEAQAYITGSFPLTIETPGAIALQVINAVFFGLDLKELETYRERVNAVTVDDIQRVAQKYLHPDRLTIVLVGDASKFAGQLPAIGFDRVERISLGDLDLTTPDLRRKRAEARPAVGPDLRGPAYVPDLRGPAYVPDLRGPAYVPDLRGPAYVRAPAYAASNARQQGTARESAESLVARAIAAKGGIARLRAIKTVSAVADMAVDGMIRRITFPMTTSIRYPDRFRTDAMTPVGRLIQVLNGDEYWVQDSRGPRQAPEAVAAEMRANRERDVVLTLVALSDGKVAATRGADVVETGRVCPAIEVTAKDRRPITLVLDPDTALVWKLRYTLGASQAMEEEFSDYRDVGGVKVAFKGIVRGPGVPTIERTVRSVRYNAPVDPSLFVRPSHSS